MADQAALFEAEPLDPTPPGVPLLTPPGGSQLCPWQLTLWVPFAFEAEEAACDGVVGVHDGGGGDGAPPWVGIGVAEAGVGVHAGVAVSG